MEKKLYFATVKPRGIYRKKIRVGFWCEYSPETEENREEALWHARALYGHKYTAGFDILKIETA